MSADPALGFWLRHAENEGALHERAGAVTTVVLPDTLRTEYGLPEEVTVTADPEVAREARRCCWPPDTRSSTRPRNGCSSEATSVV